MLKFPRLTKTCNCLFIYFFSFSVVVSKFLISLSWLPSSINMIRCHLSLNKPPMEIPLHSCQTAFVCIVFSFVSLSLFRGGWDEECGWGRVGREGWVAITSLLYRVVQPFQFKNQFYICERYAVQETTRRHLAQNLQYR